MYRFPYNFHSYLEVRGLTTAEASWSIFPTPAEISEPSQVFIQILFMIQNESCISYLSLDHFGDKLFVFLGTLGSAGKDPNPMVFERPYWSS